MKKEYDFSQGRRGALEPVSPGKTRITIRLDDDVLGWFRDRAEDDGGGNYQTMINAALREHVQRTVEPLEDTLRRVVREELQALVAALPDRDLRSADEILGYDEFGLPG